MDGDGIIDLVFSNGTAPLGVSIFHGVGDGSFTRLANVVAGQNTTAVVLADLRNSGKLDLITSDYFPGAVNVLRNSGDGRFQNLIQVKNIGTVAGFRQLDFNHDGNMDVVASTASGLVVLQGTGVAAQPFLLVQKYPFGRCSDVETADFAGDKTTSLALITALGNIIFLRIDSAGALSEWNRYSTPGAGAELHAGDFNGDGVLDLVTSDVYVFYGTAPGHFQPPILLSNQARSGGSAVVADFNHDGISDLAYTGDDADQLPAYRLGTVAGLGPAIALPFTAPGYQLVAADYNADGALDIIGTNTYSTGASRYVAYGDGTGTFSRCFRNHLGALRQIRRNRYFQRRQPARPG